jgi:hypothetical protein
MAIFAKTADGWTEIGAGEGGGGASSWGRVNGETPTGSFTVTDPSFPSFAPVGSTWDYFAWGQDADGNVVPGDVGDHTVDLSGGLYWVLTVGGGGYEFNTEMYLNQGQPGLVNEGLWEFATNPTTQITVGRKGSTAAAENISKWGNPSFVGSYGTQGFSTYGHSLQGRGAQTFNDSTGYKSFITGTELQYATGYDVSESGPGKAGRTGSPTSAPSDGCVILAVRTDVEAVPVPEPAPELPGVGGFATITGVTGTYTKHTYDEWVAYEWTGDGSVTTSGGLADILLVGGGGFGATFGGITFNGSGGHAVSGLHDLNVSHNVVVASASNAVGDNSELGPYMARGGSRTDGRGAFLTSEITGISDVYGRGSQASPRANKGEGGKNGVNGSSGVCIIRVPKEYADNVQETFHGWDSFALVTDGVVTEVTRVPDNEPHTLDAEWVACSSEVSVGWVLVDGDFYSPDEAPEPEPEPTPDSVFKFTSTTTYSPKEGQVRLYSRYGRFGKKDLEGEDFTPSFLQIARLQVSGDKPYDKETLITRVSDASYWSVYGHAVPDYADVNSAEVDVAVTVRDNVLWTDQVIPVMGKSGDYGPGSIYHYNGNLRVYPIDADGNPWPIPVAGQTMRYHCPGMANPETILRIVEVKEESEEYFTIVLDELFHYNYTGKSATLEIVE